MSDTDEIVESAAQVLIAAGLKPKRKKIRKMAKKRLAELRASARERNKDLRLERGPGPEDEDEDTQRVAQSVFECTAWRVDR
jgi:hypothetical protein